MAAPNGSEPKWHWVRLLLLVPFVAMLWVASYNRTDPAFLGFPFFYWYQLLWVIVAAAIAGLVYKLEH